MVKIGVLDYAQIDEGKDARTALNETVILARLAELLEYNRFWVAEHHNVPAFANGSPELLIMRLADATSTIRVGSGGVMLPHYSPYKVAENFRILEGFHPNRIDLGIGNNSGTLLVNHAMNENKRKKFSYNDSILDLVAFFNDNIDKDHRLSGITANPVMDTKPEMFILSTGINSAKMTAAAGLGYTFGLFPFVGMDKLDVGAEAAKTYRSEFKPSLMSSKPKVMIAPFIAIADTNEEAEEYALALDLWLLGKNAFSEFDRFPSPETARRYAYTEEDKEQMKINRKYMVVGDKERAKAQMDKLIDQFGADEVLFIPLLPGIDARKRAYQLIAETFLS